MATLKNTSRLVSIDPGANSGIAFFINGVLTNAYLIKGAREKPGRMMGKFKATGVIIEHMVAYPGSPVDSNDLISATIDGVYLAGQFRAPMELIDARGWKGTRDKKVHCDYIMNNLTVEERRIVELTTPLKKEIHNVIDAAGIGLWRLGRI